MQIKSLNNFFKKMTALLIIILIPSIYTPLYPEEEIKSNNGPNRKKYISINIDFYGLLWTGPSAGIEFTGLGNFGFYGQYQQVGYSLGWLCLEDKGNFDINGNGVRSGIKYYFNGPLRAHNSSIYTAAEFQYYYITVKDNVYSGNRISITSINYLLYLGVRGNISSYWFIDGSIGAGYGTIEINERGIFFNGNRYRRHTFKSSEVAFSGYKGFRLTIKSAVGITF